MKHILGFLIIAFYTTAALSKVTVEELMPTSSLVPKPNIKIISAELPKDYNCDRNASCYAGFVQFVVENASSLQGVQDSIELEFYRQECGVVYDGNGYMVIPKQIKCLDSKIPERIILNCDKTKDMCYGGNPTSTYLIYWALYPSGAPGSVSGRYYAHKIQLKRADGNVIPFANGDVIRIINF